MISRCLSHRDYSKPQQQKQNANSKTKNKTMGTMNLSGTGKGGRPSMNGVFQLRVTNEPTLETGKKPPHNKYLKFTLETVGKYVDGQVLPETTGPDGNVTDWSGYEFTFNAVHLKDGRNIGLSQLHQAAGLPLEIEIGDDGLPVGIEYTSVEVFAELTSKIEARIGDDGKPITDPFTGEAQKTVQSNIRQLFPRPAQGS